MVASSMSGAMLPFQAIFKGTRVSSLPSVMAQKASEALGCTYLAGGERHWSTLACMKDVSSPASSVVGWAGRACKLTHSFLR
jgi:hypothetical protein